MKIPIKQIILEATKWKGQSLSKSSINRINRAGISKPIDHITDGLERGTNNILSKFSPDVTVSKINMPYRDVKDTGGGYFENNKIFINNNPSTIQRFISPPHSVLNNRGETNFVNALIGRHEAYEAKGLNDAIDRARKSGTNEVYKDAGTIYSKVNPVTKRLSGYSHQVIGSHNSANVLANESKDLQKLRYIPQAQNFIKNRQNEYKVLKNVTGVDLNGIINKKTQTKFDDFESLSKDDGYYIK